MPREQVLCKAVILNNINNKHRPTNSHAFYLCVKEEKLETFSQFSLTSF